MSKAVHGALNKSNPALASVFGLGQDSIVNALPHPILILSENNEISFVNVAAEDFFKTSSAMLLRQTLVDIMPFGSPLLALIDQVRRGGATINEYSVDVSTPKTGDGKVVDIFAGPLPDEENDQVVLMLQYRAVAHMIERQLTHRAAARSVSGMAAVLAHEIKNPLSGIRGAAQLLETDLNDEDRNLTKLICTETDRICNLVDRMEVFGDERPVPMEPINIHDVLDHVKQIAVNGFGKHLTITEDYDPSLPAIPGNRDKLIQAFLNLVKNACESIENTRSDGKVVLSTSFRPGVHLTIPGSKDRVSLPLEIAIEDNGAGIPEELKPHLFDPFVTTKAQGTGLGLALVAKIIGDHGGIIECDSRPRKTLFRALLPMQGKTNKPKKG